MDPHSPKKFIATKYCFFILGDDTSFFFFLSLYVSLFFVFMLCYVIYFVIINFCKNSFLSIVLFIIYYYYYYYYYYYLINYFFMFRNVPCSGFYRRPFKRELQTANVTARPWSCDILRFAVCSFP